jgi:hypothetical protein
VLRPSQSLDRILNVRESRWTVAAGRD